MPKEEEKIIEEELVPQSDSEVGETTEEIAIPVVAEKEVLPADNFNANNRDNRDRRKNERRPSRRPERVRQEFDNKVISVRRVTRVVSGGRRFSFSIAMVIGDRKGRVGVGIGKASDTPVAIDKAMRAAKKNIVKISLTNKNSIAHPVEAKYSSIRISLMPAPGKGVIAGSAVRVVLELAGITEVSSKILSRSKNKLNIARATIKALGQLKEKKIKIKE
ncbi:MAG: 30S ribosomal protein S5 [Patescibacteria group bacterium]